MSSPTDRPPARQRRRTRATRARILDAALRELGRNPDSSLGDIAEAAGVARRTLYTHFAGRAALVRGLTEDAVRAIGQAMADASALDAGPGSGRGAGTGSGPGTDPDLRSGPESDPASALARFVLTLWPVGDAYRTLIGLAPQDLGPDHLSELLAPARETVAGILAEGQRQGVFHAVVPPGPLSAAVEAHLLALLGTVNAGIWADDGSGAATSALIAAGVDSATATATVRRLHDPGRLPAEFTGRSVTFRPEEA
ncbi:TetR/AcrR family transcriptional regulator [Streptomyces chartreusis]|uniref:TetR/AcrR family transcriptional regulator n=1 Tax=Streptomyces chartreusis TaxID=1969 RepID=UPI002E7FD04A|nr:TetR/AcrR family transcriptional regulator [Streptomyces chartreusis]WUB19405.1 TetR/AcrR family transcriptional regulator [Streptomyces chartreusis]